MSSVDAKLKLTVKYNSLYNDLIPQETGGGKMIISHTAARRGVCFDNGQILIMERSAQNRVIRHIESS